MATHDVQVYIDGKLVDLFNPEDVAQYFSYRIMTGDELDRRAGSNSNTLDVPATKNNNLTFGYYNDETTLNDSGVFTFKKDCIVFAGGTKIFAGFAVGKLHSAQNVDLRYSINMYGNNLAWADKMSEMKIKYLTGVNTHPTTGAPTFFPNVTFDIPNVLAAFDNSEADEFCAPLVCYRQWRPQAEMPDQKQKFDLDDFKYWIFLRPLIKQMFYAAGYTISSELIDNAQFGKLITYFFDNQIYEEGAEFNYSDLINEERNCLECIRGVQHAWNMFFWTDEVAKVVYGNTYGVFFNQGSKDIHETVDVSKGRKRYPYEVGENKIRLGWKSDTDGFRSINLTVFKEQAGCVEYGLRRSTSEKDDVVKVIENPFFGPAYMGAEMIEISDYGGGAAYGAGTYGWKLVMPYIFTQPPVWDKFAEGAITTAEYYYRLNVKPEDDANPDPRILYFAGMKACSAFRDSPHPTTGPEFDDPVAGTFDFEGIPLGSRPYAYSIDILNEDGNAEDNILDFCDYIEPQAIADYRDGVMGLGGSAGTVITPGTPFKFFGLGKKHWLPYLATIDDGHIWDGFNNWKNTEILGLDFRQLISYKNLDYILLEVTKFNPVSKETTGTKLLKRVNPTQSHIDRFRSIGTLFIQEYWDLRRLYNRYL